MNIDDNSFTTQLYAQEMSKSILTIMITVNLNQFDLKLLLVTIFDVLKETRVLMRWMRLLKSES